MESFRQQENDETCDQQQSQRLEESDTDNYDAENQTIYADVTSRQTPLFSGDMINEHIRSLSKNQRKDFNVLMVKRFYRNSRIKKTTYHKHFSYIYYWLRRSWKIPPHKTINTSL